MRHRSAQSLRIAGLLALLIAVTPGWAFAADVELLPVSQLLEEPAEHDGAIIHVEGELVGDYGYRSDGSVWTQLNDDSYARRAIVDGGPRTGSNIGIGIRMPAELARDLDPVGGYRLEGPLVRASGVWRHHDPDRGGESYLDVTALVVVEPGRRLTEGPDWIVFIIGSALLAVSLVMWWQGRRTSE